MNKILLITLLGISNLSLVMAQGGKSIMEIGGIIPDIEMNMVRGNNIEKVKLSEFKGKKIIIDYWNKWCTSCINSFPKVEELQNKYGSELVFLAVSNDSFKDFQSLRKRSENLKKSNLIFIVEDSMFRKHIPPPCVPFYVWLGENLKLYGTTLSYSLNDSSIQKFIKDKGVGINVSKERSNMKSKNRFLFADMSTPKTINDTTYFSKFIKSDKSETYPVFGRPIFDTVGSKIIGLEFLNVTLCNILSAAYDYIPPFDILTNDKSLLYILEPNNKEGSNYNNWREQTSYSYQTVFKSEAKWSTGINCLKKDMAKELSIKAELKDTLRKVLLLQKIGDLDIKSHVDPKSDQIEEINSNFLNLQNGGIRTLTRYLSIIINKDRVEYLPIIDSTRITFPIDINIKFERTEYNVESLNNLLSKFGLSLKPVSEVRKTLIISKLYKQIDSIN